MDGVVHRGAESIPGAERFIGELLRRRLPLRFLTDNSRRTRRDVARKLSRMGIDVEAEPVFTCAMATARFLALQKPRSAAFVIGEGRLSTALYQNGYAVMDHDPDYAVVREGRTFFRVPFCKTPRNGRLHFTAEARKDAERGGWASRTAATRLKPPCSPNVAVGDAMETATLGGVRLGFHTALVLSSGTRRENLDRFAYRPEIVVDSIADLTPLPDDSAGGPLAPRHAA